MYESFNTGLDLDECTVIGDEDDLTLDLVTNLEVGIEVVPRMRSELLESEGDPLLLLVEIKNNDLDLLVKGNNLLRMVDSAP